ncbi:MAG: NUDIX domain-containing protein [Chloroflexi bacterium]|nr:NUDIX domain-containing protein [Chloroflexota bacterium]
MERARAGENVRSGADEEALFLAGYDITAWPRPSLAVDVAILTIAAGAAHVVLVERTRPPAQGRWALPGGFVRIDESLDDAVGRVLERETGLRDMYTAQLATFGEVDRDPRGRVVTVAHYALVPAARIEDVVTGRAGCALARVTPAGPGGDAPFRLVVPGGAQALAFDHDAIVAAAVERVQGRLWYTPVAFELVPDEFTLLDLQRVYEAILGRSLDKNGFRRRVLASGLVAPTGRRREGLRARPPELFRFAGDGRGG